MPPSEVENELENGGKAQPSSPKYSGALTVGGQAVIEGVMMRSPNRISMSVRKPDGEIETEGWEFTPINKRHKLFGLPIIRGTLSLGEMLYWGIKTLQLSAQMASGEMNKKQSFMAKMLSAISLVMGFLLGAGLFVYLPLFSAELAGFREQPLKFNLFAGVVRVLVFLLYLAAISLMPDVKRLFRYHGAEHRTIHAFERGEPLVAERVQRYSTHHPRCGTSFILIVAVGAIFIFAAIDAALYAIWNFAPKPILRLPIHMAILPILAGISYEMLKLSAKLSRNNFFGKMLVAPGLWLQRITTKAPDNEMVEVAIAALMDSIVNIPLGKRSENLNVPSSNDAQCS